MKDSPEPGGLVMRWETPSFTEVRMDAEIGSYQDDFDPAREEPAFVIGLRGTGAPAAEATSADE